MLANIGTRFALLIALLFVPVEVRQQSETFHPPQTQGEQTSRQNTMEILPASYIGCWRGVVTSPDSNINLNGCLNGPFVPELYTLCYRRKLTGKFEVTFGGVQMDTDVPAQYQISGTTGKVDVLSSDGVARVKLRSFIHFDQKIALPAAKTSSWSMEEKTDMACELKDGEMEVRAVFLQASDGVDCFEGTWHTRFRRFDD